MNELLSETFIAFSAVIFLWILYYFIIRKKLGSQPGYKLLIVGFLLLFIGSILDLTNGFQHLTHYVFTDNVRPIAAIERATCSLLGLVLLSIGLHRLLPTIVELSITQKNINNLNNKLEILVHERTFELNQVNQKLRQEISKREKAQSKLNKQMLHDPLTELPNRYALLEYLDHERLRSASHPNNYAIFIIDLDQFKVINDSLGHTVGDKVIKAIANRLAFNHRSDDFLGRLGGDEFVLVMSMNMDDEQAAALQTFNNATTLIALVASELKVDSNKFNLSASIGISVFNYSASQSSQDILRQADIALYNAKEKGCGFFSFFQPEMQQKALSRLKQSKELHDALANKELFLQYQPQVNNQKKLIGLEALLRWHHPINGIVDPENFIALSEEIGIIDQLGRYILELACQQCHNLASHSYPKRKLKVAVNISPSHFLQNDFVEQIQTITARYSLKKIQLVLEITEEVAIEDIDNVIKKINQLRQLNIRCSLDDFGTGYSSLTYLKQLPIDTVKIDKSFILELHENKDDASIVEAILTMTRALAIDVIAEGIENNTQYQFLAALQCQYYQGYYFGKPTDIATLLSQGKIIQQP